MADSISTQGIRLTTMELTYHRFIHSEFMTHRMFSRNAASSRAIPVEKMLEQVQQSPAMPIHWGKNQPGMQAREEVNSPLCAIEDWKLAGDNACYSANGLSRLGLHKQVVNRLLEPFQYIKVIVTATDGWDNFFKVRNHPDAQPEMQELARCMKEAMDASSPKLLKPGEWHAPYYYGSFTDEKGNPDVETALKLSVARCARVSYLNHDNSSPDIEKDIALYNRLLEAGHYSPFEHQATPMQYPEGYDSDSIAVEDGITHLDKWGSLWSGNFRGFLQYRQLLAATR